MARHGPEITAPGLRIGLLGGSFNPAHEGHVHISLQALKALQLDRVWWLVSPQNPLKSSRGMAPLADRLQTARKVARHPKITITDIERRLGTRFTADTLRALKQRYPQVRFVWLMGADNMIQLPRWRQWRQIVATVPIAIYPRDRLMLKAQLGLAAASFPHARVAAEEAGHLASLAAPALLFLGGREHPASATAIRRGEMAKSPA